jgi:hypothetical protein
MEKPFKVRWAAMCLCTLGQLAAAPAIAAERPSMVLVFDSTNSMWGQFEGKNKVVLLREALSRAFDAAQGKLDMGLLSYGSNEKQACSANNIVRPMGPVSPQDYSRAVNAVPLGKGGTPLARALQAAASLAEYETRPATLVMIADGADNCRGDPCAAAAQLEAAAPGVTVHVIALDRDKQRLSNLNCMAKATGGVFFAAADGAELEAALDAIIANVAHSAVLSQPSPPRPAAAADAAEPAEAAAQEPSEGPAPQARVDSPAGAATSEVPAPPEADDRLATADTGPTGTLRLSARLTDEMPLIHKDLMWRIFAAEPEDDGSFKIVALGEGPRPEFSLREGDYVVHVGYGRARAIKRVTVKQGVLDEVLVLNAGGLRLSAVRSDGQAIPRNDVSFAVYSSEQDQFGQRELILPTVPPGKTVRLNAGSYHIVSQYGDANAVVRSDVKVEAGKLSDAVVSHEAAKVTLKLVNQPGGEALADTSWSVETPAGDVVSQSVGAFPTHILAPGDYTIVARHDGIGYSRKYTVELGYDQEVEIVAGDGG